MSDQMAGDIPTLKNAPIVEAVLDVDCDLPPGVELASMEVPGKARFGDAYPKVRKQFVQSLNFRVGPGAASNMVTDDGAVNALQFRNEEQNQLVQMRAQGYAFNRLAPYTSLDDYLPEIERTWKIYNELVSPTRIRAIRLRYINRIQIPIPSDRLELDDYFNIGPRVPDENGLSLASFLIQQSGVENRTGLLVSLVLAAQPVVEDTFPVIFDITVTNNSSVQPSDWPKINECVQDLRRLKNAIFANSLSEQCIKLFQ